MDLTIVLTLKGRDPFTYRWLSYMNELGAPIKILIADGGNNDEIEKHLREKENYPNLNYEYIRYPFDVTTEDFYKKFYDALKRVETKYLLLADNDDFYILDYVDEHIDFLDHNLDYVSSRGSLVNLELLNKKYEPISSTNGHAYLTRQVFAESITEESYLERISKLCLNMSKFDYYGNWYSITRTEALVEIWSKLLRLRVKEVIVLEILSHIMLVSNGKIRITPDAFYFRQSHTSSFGDTLVKDNDFLQRCLATDGLSEFNYALSNFQILENLDEKPIVLNNVAFWLNEFIFNLTLSKRKSLRIRTIGFLRINTNVRRILYYIKKAQERTKNPKSPYEELISKYLISNMNNRESYNA